MYGKNMIFLPYIGLVKNHTFVTDAPFPSCAKYHHYETLLPTSINSNASVEEEHLK